MVLRQIPPSSTLTDKQFLQIEGADGVTTSYAYDAQTRSLYFKESQVLYPNQHGISHIAEDPIPAATCDSPGLMAPDDKCKLDALLQTRVGVLGFSGAGHPTDGGWLTGDIILSAGTDFISLERIGNIVKFTVDSPIPFAGCPCEECAQIFFVQDETTLTSIRPATCAGKLPGLNTYGEIQFFLFPESTLIDPSNPATTLKNKGNYPALIFKRYDDTIVPGAAEYEMVLQRDTNNNTTTQVGWAFSPGSAGKAELVYYVGKDSDGNQLSFQFDAETEPGMLGAILFNGNLITKKKAVIVGYVSTILSTNLYTIREWNIDTQQAVGSSFSAKNVWQYSNPENGSSGPNPKSLILDSTVDILPIGTLVDLWFFKVGEVSGSPINRYYFSQRPSININNIWSPIGQVQFGDISTARDEVPAGPGSEDASSSVDVSEIRDFEFYKWGLTGFHDPFVSYDIVTTAGTEQGDLSTQHRAVIDTDIPGLKVVASTTAPDDFSERPVWLWNRTKVCNAIISADIGRPSSSDFVPYDFVLRAVIDEFTERYVRVVEKGLINGVHYIRVCGVNFHDLPPFGVLRTLYTESNINAIYKYNRKLLFPTVLTGTDGTPGTEPIGGGNVETYCNSIVLTGGSASNTEYSGDVGDILELLHQEYNSPVVRVEFSFDQATNLVELQFKVGTLDMSLPYEEDVLADDADDYVRGLAPGYAVSAVYSQAGVYTGVGTQPDSSLEGFVIYDGGIQLGGTQSEYWNRLKIMLRDNQVWIWWNELLIPPSASLSAALASPVTISTPYFTIDTDSNRLYGKAGVRMWPGAVLRRMDVRAQNTQFSEMTYGQIEII